MTFLEKVQRLSMLENLNRLESNLDKNTNQGQEQSQGLSLKRLMLAIFRKIMKLPKKYLQRRMMRGSRWMKRIKWAESKKKVETTQLLTAGRVTKEATKKDPWSAYPLWRTKTIWVAAPTSLWITTPSLKSLLVTQLPPKNPDTFLPRPIEGSSTKSLVSCLIWWTPRLYLCHSH